MKYCCLVTKQICFIAILCRCSSINEQKVALFLNSAIDANGLTFRGNASAGDVYNKCHFLQVPVLHSLFEILQLHHRLEACSSTHNILQKQRSTSKRMLWHPSSGFIHSCSHCQVTVKLFWWL